MVTDQMIVTIFHFNDTSGNSTIGVVNGFTDLINDV